MSSVPNFQLKETEGDLFSAKVSLAHCVASDLKMGAGIAIKFRDTFKQIDKLKAQNPRCGGLAVLEDNTGDNQRYIYYLITKTSTYDKPTYDTLQSSLEKMKDHMVRNDVKQLAIPRIGCGLDGLQWPKVKAVLETVFENSPNIEITVFNFVRH